jgi:hypothetical protein
VAVAVAGSTPGTGHAAAAVPTNSITEKVVARLAG